MKSDFDNVIQIDGGLQISAERAGMSSCEACGYYFEWPRDTGKIKIDGNQFYIAGG